MRSRIEDLGRIAVMLDNILELEFWDAYSGRRKDFMEYFYALGVEQQQDLLHTLIYGMETAKEKIYEVSAVAWGTDSFNDPFEYGS